MKSIRKSMLPVLAVVLLLSCVVYSFAASNDKHNAAAAELYDEDYYFLENLASEKYNYLLRAWSNGARYLTKDTIVYPSFYAGAMSDDNKNLVILVTQLDQDVVDYFGSLIDLDHVRFTQVSSSLNELFDAKDIVNRYIRDRENPELCSAITATGISYDQNAVNIYLKFDTPSHITDAIAEQFSIENGFPCKIQFLEFEHNPPDDPVPNPPSYNENDAAAPHSVSGIIVQPGSPLGLYATSNTSYVRSTGFWAKNSKGELGIVTASHSEAYKGQPAYAFNSEHSKMVDFGSVTQYLFNTTVDAAFVVRREDRFTPINYVDGWDFQLKSSTKEMRMDETVYMSGRASGLTMGKVLEPHFNPSQYDPTGEIPLTDVVLVEAVNTEGDSGGIVAGGGTASSRYIAGVISGGGPYRVIRDGKPQMIQTTYYSRAEDIINSLNLQIY